MPHRGSQRRREAPWQRSRTGPKFASHMKKGPSGVTRRDFLRQGAALTGGAFLARAPGASPAPRDLPEPEARPLALWYRHPAAQWIEALPLGNGRLGAMVFGGIERER